MNLKKKASILVPIRMNPQQLAVANWLAVKTKRTRAGAIKWATEEKAKELGYKPEVTKKKQ